MKLNIGRAALRFLSIVPLAIATVVLGYAALFAVLAIREPLWILLALSMALVACSVILVRCSYLAWKRPSTSTIKEVCDWTGYAVIGAAIVASENLRSPGREWLAWSAVVVSILSVVIVVPWLTRFLLRTVFRAEFRAEHPQ